MISYPRTSLADELVTALQGRAGFSDAHNGLFLAAPRRTGKSTFLQGDLRPALERGGVVVVYVDLWADTARDPAALIATVIGRALQPHLGLVAKAAKTLQAAFEGFGNRPQLEEIQGDLFAQVKKRWACRTPSN